MARTKENCPDLRNTRVVDVIRELEEYHIQVDVYDPWVDAAEAQEECGISLVDPPKDQAYDGVVLAVGHQQFREMGAKGVAALCSEECSVIFDLKYILDSAVADARL